MPYAPQQHRARPKAEQRSPQDVARRRLYRTDAWTRLRRAVLQRDLYLCQTCGASVAEGDGSAHVDHVRPAESMDDVLCDEANLQTLCEGCHSRKTRREMGGGG